MTYTWIEKSINKYGQEVTQDLIRQQQEHEKKNYDNDCDRCGRNNEGSIHEFNNKPTLIHFGLWSNGKCNYCGRLEN